MKRILVSVILMAALGSAFVLRSPVNRYRAEFAAVAAASRITNDPELSAELLIRHADLCFTKAAEMKTSEPELARLLAVRAENEVTVAAVIITKSAHAIPHERMDSLIGLLTHTHNSIRMLGYGDLFALSGGNLSTFMRYRYQYSLE